MAHHFFFTGFFSPYSGEGNNGLTSSLVEVEETKAGPDESGVESGESVSGAGRVLSDRTKGVWNREKALPERMKELPNPPGEGEWRCCFAGSSRASAGSFATGARRGTPWNIRATLSPGKRDSLMALGLVALWLMLCFSEKCLSLVAKPDVLGKVVYTDLVKSVLQDVRLKEVRSQEALVF